MVKRYPEEKYHYTIEGTTVTAETTFAGKRVYAVAKCAPDDKFDEETGKHIAAVRCALKVAKKRRAFAKSNLENDKCELECLNNNLKKDMAYYMDASSEVIEYEEKLNRLEKNI